MSVYWKREKQRFPPGEQRESKCIRVRQVLVGFRRQAFAEGRYHTIRERYHS